MNIRLSILTLLIFFTCSSVSASPPADTSAILNRLKAEDAALIMSSNKVGKPVLAALSQAESTDVVISFHVPFGYERKGRARINEWMQAIKDQHQAIFGNHTGNGLTVLHKFEAINAIVANISTSALKGLVKNPNILRINLPARTHVQLAEAGSLVNLPLAHNNSPGQGIGGTIAILDTGIRSTHDDFGNRVVAEQCFCNGGCCPNGEDTQSGAGSAADGHGHGTHVAGIALGNGSISPGVGSAPGANIHVFKVLSDAGGGNTIDIAYALDSIISNPEAMDSINSVNISIGTFDLYASSCDSYYMETASAIDTLRSNGIVTVVSAGNNGSTTQMTSPACISNALSVGNTYDAAVGPIGWCIDSNVPCTSCSDFTTQADQVVCGSNRNSGTDLYAPGALIISSYNTCDECTDEKGGTSMSSPLVAGCAGLIMNDFETLTVDQLETVLKGSPTLVFDAGSNTSIPRLDCGDAYLKAQAIASQPQPEPDMAWLVPIINLVLF